MAAKHDITKTVKASLKATDAQIREVCQRALAPLSEHKRLEPVVEGDDGQLTITLMVIPLIGNKTPNRSWVVGVSSSNGEPGRKNVEAEIRRYNTHQQHVLGFIPAGPKTLGGRREFLLLLDALENELRALDPDAEIVRT